MAKRSENVKALFITGAIVGSLLAILLSSRIFVRFYRASSASMEPTVRMGETMVVVRTKNIRRGDIITFQYPPNPRLLFACRVVATSGDTIAIRDKQVFLNGTLLEEPYVHHEDPAVYPASNFLPEPQRSRDQFGPYRVPLAHVFVLGDNRGHSSDSRYWGSVPMELVRGKVTVVYGRDGIRRMTSIPAEDPPQ
ncbi:MAG TPA: signal peptidase I [Thermoanaerobaculia bacterium]|nr:signal peptidase I [Thermoanaerobaculia bacterium]